MYTVNTTLLITAHPHWIGTRQPSVLATVATVHETRAGVLYALDYVSPNTANGKSVLVTKFLFERDLSKRVIEVVKAAKKPRQRKQQLKAA